MNYFQQTVEAMQREEEQKEKKIQIQAKIMFLMKRNRRQTYPQLFDGIKEFIPGTTDSYLVQQLISLEEREFIRVEPSEIVYVA